ncbi:MAG: sucrase ferredoxin [Candidatus Xenobia bacterium]
MTLAGNDRTPSSGLACSALSMAHAEPLYGTCPLADRWVLIELPEPWGPKAVEESSLSREVKLALKRAAGSSGRLTAIKQPGRDAAPYHLFIGMSKPTGSWLHRFTIERYEDALSFDFDAAFAGTHPNRHPVVHPLFLVCTNGKRDTCCARYGVPIYDEMIGRVGEAVWQCSHVGGHRFSGNVGWFPHGMWFGRIRDDNVHILLESCAMGEVQLSTWRGRSCYREPVQAAEYFVREQHRLVGVNDVVLEKAEMQDDDHWQVTFRLPEGRSASVRIERYLSDYCLQASCGKAVLEPVTLYRQPQQVTS